MKKKFDILIQARLTSRRLPNKVIKKIGNRTALKMLLDRLKKIKFINNTVIILPNNKKNNFLNNYVKKLGYKTFRGSENNVLDRYYKASKKFKSTNIIRVTSDCPFLDFEILNKMIKIFTTLDFDYMSNINPRTFPKGLDIEIFTFKTLKKTWLLAKTKYDKEHVTPHMVRNKNILHYNFKNNVNYSNLRITLDTAKDLKILNNIYRKLTKIRNFVLKDIIKLYKKSPKIFRWIKLKKKILIGATTIQIK